MPRKRPEFQPWQPAEYTAEIIGALQALSRGEARGDQQRDALTYIIEELAATYQPEFHPDGDRLSAFMGGRRFVGLQLVKLLRLNPAALAKRPREPSEQPS